MILFKSVKVLNISPRFLLATDTLLLIFNECHLLVNNDNQIFFGNCLKPFFPHLIPLYKTLGFLWHDLALAPIHTKER